MQKMRLIVRLIVRLAAGIALSALGAQLQEAPLTPRYRVTDLGTLPNCDITYATGVNDAGQVAGYAYHFVAPGHGHEIGSRPFVWQSGQLTELPRLGGEHGQALAINSHGDLAGYANTVDEDSNPVIWKRNRQVAPTCLSKLPGRATCLLEDGTAAGCVFLKGKDQAAMWTEGRMQLLGDARDAESVCEGINRQATAVGMFIPAGHSTESVWSQGDRHAVMWKAGREIALPELGGSLSDAEAINEAGIAVGWYQDKDRESACMWKDGRVEALPTLPGYYTEAHSINRSSVIVGEESQREKHEGFKACIWRGGKLEDLNRLIPAGTGWQLSLASHISDNGLIVGYGSYNKYPDDRQRAFLLTPVGR